MDEDDLFAGSMEIDDPAATPASRAAAHVSAPRPGVDEDMSEVAQIMLNLKVRGAVPCHGGASRSTSPSAPWSLHCGGGVLRYCIKPHLLVFVCHYSLQSGPRYLC